MGTTKPFTSFNQALVAKQGWRLLQVLDFLVSRVLQARYFRNSSFFRAEAGSNPSFIWRSFLWGREIIRRGIRWRIRNRKKTSVYNDNWLPRPDTFKPFSPPTLPENSVVADLINEENQWDEEKLTQHFLQEDADVILKIPLPIDQSKDAPLWHFDRRREYSVKSEYQLVLKIKFLETSSSSRINSN